MVEILMPRIGFSMSEGELSAWLVEDGARVETGQPIFEIEAEKTTVEVDAPASGVVRIKEQPGNVFDVGTVLGHIE